MFVTCITFVVGKAAAASVLAVIVTRRIWAVNNGCWCQTLEIRRLHVPKHRKEAANLCSRGRRRCRQTTMIAIRI
jgi:hypothetical protein